MISREFSRNPAWPLIFITHATAGLFFAYETAGALAPDMEKRLGYTTDQTGLLYSAYSIPSFISIFINGYLNKKLGGPKCVALLSFVVALGVTIVSLSSGFYMMLLGQLIFGLGASPMFLTCTCVTGTWFGTDTVGKKKLAIALGLQFSWMRFLSFAAFMVLPLISLHTSFRLSMWTPAIVCWSSFASGLIFYLLDKANKYTENTEAIELNDLSSKTESTNDEPIGQITNGKTAKRYTRLNATISDEASEGLSTTEFAENDESLSDGADSPLAKSSGDALLATKETGETKNDLEKALVEEEKEAKVVENEEEQKWYSEFTNGLKTLRSFPPAYWLVLFLILVFITDLYTMTAFLTKYLVDTSKGTPNELSPQDASAITSLVCLANVITSPICGWLSGYTGWRIKYIILGAVNLVSIHCLFAFASPPPAIVLASALGLTQSIMDTNMWQSLIFTVPKKDYTFALSAVSISYNFTLVVFPAFCGFLQRVTHTWDSVNYAFIAFSGCSVILAIALKFVDLKNGSVLDLPFVKQTTKT